MDCPQKQDKGPLRSLCSLDPNERIFNPLSTLPSHVQDLVISADGTNSVYVSFDNLAFFKKLSIQAIEVEA